MANRPTAHHSLNGDELRTIIEQRVKQGVGQSLNLRAMYAFPLVKYKVTIEIVPYRPQGQQEPMVDDKNVQRCVIDGEAFVAVIDDAVELVHDSPVIGWDKDPQEERKEVGIGVVETKRIDGQFIDTHVGKRIEIEEPELPPPSGRRLGQGPIKPPIASHSEPPLDAREQVRQGRSGTAAQVPVMAGNTVPAEPVNALGLSEAEAKAIQQQEAETWSAPKPDSDLQRAIANEEILPGRVTKLNK